MKEIVGLIDFVHLFRDYAARDVVFRYDPERDARLKPAEIRTAFDRYFRTRLLKEYFTSDIPLVVKSVAVTGDFTNWKKPVPMRREEPGYSKSLKLKPGIYHYKFVVNHRLKEARQVAIDDPMAVRDWCAPDPGNPGLKRSGLIVYPKFGSDGRKSRSAAGFSWEHCRAKFDRISADTVALKVVVPAAEVSQLLVLSSTWEKELIFVAEVEGFKYFYALLPNEHAHQATLRLIGPTGNSLDFVTTEGHGLHPLNGKAPRNAILDNLTPEWAKAAIWYTLIPDRFRHESSDASASPRIVERWKQDWHSLQDGESNYYPDVYFRKYLGNLAGIRAKVPYLKDLGINALCLTPVFWADSYHKYDTRDLRHIDPELGSDPEGDRKLIAEAGETADPSTWVFTTADKEFLELVGFLHAQGMRVVVDGVFGHVGDQFWAFRDVQQHGKSSPYYPWFWINKVESDRKTGAKKLDFETFFGFGHLPKFRLTARGLHSGVEQHIFDITQRWMLPHGPGSSEFGVDGWRLDVANEMPIDFWRRWRKHVKALKPESFIIGEMLGTAYEPFLVGDSLDAIINYRFGALAVNYFVNDHPAVPSAEMAEGLLRHSSSYRDSCTFAMQNVLDSHDVDRIASRIKNRNRPYGALNKIQYGHHGFDGGKPNEIDYRIVRMLTAFQVLNIGAPHIVYGTEAGMWGSNDPHCRKPMLWDDLGEYDVECCGYPADQGHRLSLDRPVFDTSLHADMRELFRIRRSYAELTWGDLQVVLPADPEVGFGIVRSHQGHITFGIFNRSVASRELDFSLSKLRAYASIIPTLRAIAGEKLVPKLTGDRLSVILDRKSFVLLSDR